ncbi:hypothetical protein MAPG_02121 [Magnaporthiopsis poae ATCC 64411]|uniref:Uncharacterized protein n=1 Tax=Magnaporthiopsis poae (strain ATCC 64411 / 73-15) TaxID=644358 RepID=A0A0C4DQH8_MAGP6|nr:hypothetical protein MAPG_02121 [Magnaporthiopsis poae ATCC 64411]
MQRGSTAQGQGRKEKAPRRQQQEPLQGRGSDQARLAAWESAINRLVAAAAARAQRASARDGEKGSPVPVREQHPASRVWNSRQGGGNDDENKGE